MVSDMMLAAHGGTCTLIGSTSCAYIPYNKINVADALNQLKGKFHDIDHLESYEALVHQLGSLLGNWGHVLLII
jgi:hypothetical protein